VRPRRGDPIDNAPDEEADHPMKPRELSNLGVPRGEAMRAAQEASRSAGLGRDALRARLRMVLDHPADWRRDPVFGELARILDEAPAAPPALRDEPVAFGRWGEVGEDFDAESVAQIRRACELPISVAGALMPDAHVGYGLPIGGVLATEGAVIPYAVGVDIACRMRLSVLDMPVDEIDSDRGRDRLARAIEAETRFGIGASFGQRGGGTKREHPVLDADWSVSPVTERFRDKAHAQLGTSGSGNHFVEFGTLTVDEDHAGQAMGLAPGAYLALLSHSGSRGTGASVCDHYSRLAMDLHPGLPRQHRHLAWLDLDSDPGREYWAAMELMGDYASANHACIHEHVVRHLGARVVAGVENHHNFAWKETHDPGDGGGPRELIVHRKGATPAGEGALGVIPGSMAQPGFVVRGLGNKASLDSASHGAGRVMSRKQAKRTFRWAHVRPMLREKGVTLLSAGIDENPNVYKDIHRVMSMQRDLVDVVARFDPRLVKMAPEGERPED
jgi:tRNA-splicing ligase RtcB